jgi:hypothetical protein
MLIEIGTKLGRLTLIEFKETRKDKRKYYKFQCECGGEAITTLTQVYNGRTRSCGCLRKESWRRKY